MRTVFTFIGAFLLSMLVAGTIAVQIAISTGAKEEFIVVFIALELFGPVTTLVLAVVYARAAETRTFTKVANAMIVAVAVVSLGTSAISFAVHRSAAEALNDAKITLPTLIVSALVILIQKWLVARRWRRTHPVESAGV